MSELIKREDVQREIQASFDGGAFRWQDGQDLMDRINAIPAVSPWHRVEEPHDVSTTSNLDWTHHATNTLEQIMKGTYKPPREDA